MANVLDINDLCVEIGGKELLRGIDITIPDGEVHALLGPNGCGKTTLVMTIMGYPEYEISKGQIRFNGKDITDLDITERARLGIGVSQQRPPAILGVRLQQIIDFVIENAPERAQEIEEIGRTFGMEKFLNRDINLGLSGGETKRSELFQLLVTHPKLVMMDEPDSGIDLEGLVIIGKMVNALFTKRDTMPIERRAGFIITHTGRILDYVHIEKAHIMLDGHVRCSGPPQILLNRIRKYGYAGCCSV